MSNGNGNGSVWTKVSVVLITVLISSLATKWIDDWTDAATWNRMEIHEAEFEDFHDDMVRRLVAIEVKQMRTIQDVAELTRIVQGREDVP